MKNMMMCAALAFVVGCGDKEDEDSGEGVADTEETTPPEDSGQNNIAPRKGGFLFDFLLFPCYTYKELRLKN